MIVKAKEENLTELIDLMLLLWPHCEREALTADTKEQMENGRNAFFIYLENGETAGFTHVSLRSDYVEGTSTSPVGYFEGVFVKKEFRGKSIASELLGACENWAREQGCKEFAGDCQLGNTAGEKFHKNAGFEEVGRIICFAKKL